MKQITPAELAAWVADKSRAQPLLLDVREPWEFQTCSIAGSLHVPMGEIPARAGEIDSDGDDLPPRRPQPAGGDVPGKKRVSESAQSRGGRRRVGKVGRSGNARLLTS
jgi:rhodanese-related sulfurtransferase